MSFRPWSWSRRATCPFGLGVAADRIDTIADFAAAAKYGLKTDGGTAAGAGARVLAELAGLIADGQLKVPIANVYPLAQVREASTELEGSASCTGW
jgi:NADPH:quinone reductase-like Zn-dependent oxidoreductase